MEDFMLQGPSSYKRPRLVAETLTQTPNFLVVSAPPAHSQPNLVHLPPSMSLFTDDSIGASMRIPVTSSMGSARQPFDGFNVRQTAPRPGNQEIQGHRDIPSIPLGDPAQLVQNADQPVAPNLLQSMNAIMSHPLNQFLPSPASSGQRFSLGDSGVLSENSINSQIPRRVQSKEWHKAISFDTRNRIIRKMAQMITSTPEQQSGSLENRMHNCIGIAQSIENETYRSANSLSQYYDMMAKRSYSFTKERNPSQSAVQFYTIQDIRRMYETFGIVYPMSSSSFPQSSSNNNRNVPLPNSETLVIPSLMGSNQMPFCTFARGQTAALQQSNHNQLIGALSMGLESEVPDVIKQLAHAYKCQERDNQENEVIVVCTLPHCRETKSLLSHIQNCPGGITCCGTTKDIIEHWNRCSISDCPMCLPVRQAERNINSALSAVSHINNQPNLHSLHMRRSHRVVNSNYPSTATSGLLTNQSTSRNERTSPRSHMWGSAWRSSDSEPQVLRWRQSELTSESNRRPQARYSPHSRGTSSRHDRRPPYASPWAPDIIFVENMRPSQSRGSLFGYSSGRNDRLQPPPYGAPVWRAPPEVMLIENSRPAHRHLQGFDEPILIQNDEEAAPTEQQQMMAIIKVVKTQVVRLEQKFRCSRRSCSTSWPCIHRRLAASVRSHETPIPA